MCCALSFDLQAEPSPRMMGADRAVLIGDSTASGFDTRLNAVFSDSPICFALMGIQPEHLFVPIMTASRAYEPINLADTLGGASVMSQITPDLVASMFPGAPRANIERYLPLLRRALAERGLVDKLMVLMALATVRVETARFDPISETPSALNTQFPGLPFNKYDWRQDLGNQGPPDGAMFKGRGFIQLTGRKNYGFYGALLGYNLTGNPELANTPQPAAQILAAYLKENELPIRSALAMGDLAMARKIVNGGVNGLDRFTAAFLMGNQMVRDYDGQRDGGTERQRDGETERQRDGETENERKLLLSLYPSIPLSLYPSISPSLCPSVPLSLRLSVPLSLRLSVSPSLCPSVPIWSAKF